MQVTKSPICTPTCSTVMSCSAAVKSTVTWQCSALNTLNVNSSLNINYDDIIGLMKEILN